MLAISSNTRPHVDANAKGRFLSTQRHSLPFKQDPKTPWVYPHPPRPPTPSPRPPPPYVPPPPGPTPPPSPQGHGCQSSAVKEGQEVLLSILTCRASDPLACPYPEPPPSPPGPRRPPPVRPSPNVPTPPPSPRRSTTGRNSGWNLAYDHDPNIVALFVECLRLATWANGQLEVTSMSMTMPISSLSYPQPGGTSKASERQIGSKV